MTLVANISTTSGQPIGGQLVFASTSNNGGAGWPITTAGITLPGRCQFSGVGGKWVLQDNLTGRNGTTSGTFDPLVVSGGTLVLNGHTITVPGLNVSTGVLDCTNSTIVVKGTNTVFGGTPLQATNGTITGGSSSTIQILQTSTNSRTFALGTNTWGTITYTLAGSTGALLITGAATIGTINFSDVTNARTLTLPASTTITIVNSNGFNVQGTASKLMTVNSSSSGTAATISCTQSVAARCDYLSLKDSTATGGAGFYAGHHSTQGTGVTGWTFADLVTATLAAPLGGLTASIAATPTVGATANAALGSLTASITATPTVMATFAAPLGALATSIQATPTDIATANAALGSLTATMTGVPSVLATASAALGALDATILASVTVTPTLSAALGSLVATTTGTVGVPVSLTADLGGLDASLSATILDPMSASAALGGLDAHAVGTVTSPSTAKPAGGGGGGWQSPPMQPTPSRLVKADATFTLNVRFSVSTEQGYVPDPDEELVLL